MTKKSTKKFTPVYTVDLTDVNTLSDVLMAFVDSKIRSQVPITIDDLDTIIDVTCSMHEAHLFKGYNCIVRLADGSIERLTAVPAEKEGYFKRLWKAIKGK